MLRMLAMLVALSFAAAPEAAAQYPDKPMRWILPFPAGGTPDVAEKLVRDGVDPIGGTPRELGALVARELPQWRELAKAANIKRQQFS